MQHTRLPIAFLLLLTIAACNKDTPTTPTPDPVVTSLLVPGTLSLATGDSTQVRAVAMLPDGTTQVVTNTGSWASSNPAVATTSASGVVTALSAGATDVTVTFQEMTAKVTVNVSSTVASPTTFWGTTTGLNSVTGTLSIALSGGTGATGTLYLGRTAVSLFGRLDTPTNIVNVAGGGFTFLGTMKNAVLSGTFTDIYGNIGGFAAIDATHMAVTMYCGTYTSDGTTPLANPDAGAFGLAAALDGTVSGTSVSSDAGGAPLIFTGRRNGDGLALTTNQGTTSTGQIQNGTATGTFRTASGATATFTATPGACQ